MSITHTYQVSGMTCGHCELSIQEEIGELPGVDGVTANYETGEVTVTGTSFDNEDVAAAITEAGYSLES